MHSSRLQPWFGYVSQLILLALLLPSCLGETSVGGSSTKGEINPGWIVCYKCNSEYDPRCGDPFDPYSIGLVNCSKQGKLEHLKDLKPTICRKNVQKIYGKVRVVRGCGYIEDERELATCVRRSGTHDVNVNYCACKGNECNTGAQLFTAQSSALMFLSALLVCISAAIL